LNHRGHRENKREDTKDKDKEKIFTDQKGKEGIIWMKTVEMV